MDATTNAGPAITVPCPFCRTRNRVRAARVDDRPKCGDCGRPILLDRPVALDDETFDAVIAGTELPILVDFHADWCAPCRMVAPIVDEIAHERRGAWLVCKVDTDRAREVAQRFRVSSIPMMAVFRNGAEVARQVGAMPKVGIVRFMDTGAPRGAA
ncbi:MAG: thioredoxin [Gemmatimonadaceae bacterium]|nr:thioredoxin [Gemmatimonadaceae bacterium]